MSRPSSPTWNAPVGRSLLVVLGGAIMVLRAPSFFTAPRLWAEEGSFYFAYAWSHGWIETIRFAPAGYPTVWANVAALLATRLVPLTHAPLVTTTMAFLLQLAPLAVIAFGRTPLWASPIARLAGIAIVLFPALTGEIWLNTTNSQTWCSLTAFLLLIEPAGGSRRRTVATAVLLALCALTSPAVTFLLPLFVAKAWATRDRGAAGHVAVLAACAAIQVATIATLAGTTATPGRFHDVHVASTALFLWSKTFVLPAFGIPAAEWFVNALWPRDGDFAATSSLVIGTYLLALAAVAIGWLTSGWRGIDRLLYAGSYGLLGLGSMLGLVGDRRILLSAVASSFRYFYVPTVVLFVVFLRNVVERTAWTVRALVCAALVAAGVIGGVARYEDTLKWDRTWPRWTAEVQAWERNPAHKLAVWPPPWTIELRPRPG